MKEKLISAGTSFLIALGGVLVAVLWFISGPWLVIAPLIGLAVLGYGCDAYARGRLLPEHPVTALRLMEYWVLLPGTLAALVSGLLIVLGVWWEPIEKATVEEKKLLAALVGAVSTFLTTAFVKAAEESDAKWVGEHVRKTFHLRYRRDAPATAHEPGICYFEAGSPGERWVYSDAYGGVSGWGWSARHTRAARIGERLTTADRIPP
jgi:hypothetical protein